MEKLQYHLVGKKFKLVTDHKAIEFIKTKVEFGSARIQRWFQRFEKFNFDVEYRKGVEMITSDALSRSLDNKILSVINNLNSEDELQNKVINHHIKLNHRKKIQADMGKIGIKISQNKINEIIKGCWTCLKKDKKHVKPGKFIHTFSPGERVALDIMEIKKKDLVVLAIDFFTRKLYGKTLKTKEASKIFEFIREVHREMPIKTLICDDGREFNNEALN
ncbi:Retrovirus-related Pol polyprotein from transposon, partial [Nosema granulosis]